MLISLEVKVSIKRENISSGKQRKEFKRGKKLKIVVENVTLEIKKKKKNSFYKFIKINVVLPFVAKKLQRPKNGSKSFKRKPKIISC